ncbi:MAG TPA: hypothetical protein VMO20_05125 [Candidatus Acidoferrum sp.]|nr:hypothetical protein [Candidatus Acidoferrum sp.]
MKVIALKIFVSLFGAFASSYAYLLGSVLYDLLGPVPPGTFRCGTGDVWALESMAMLFAPPALLGSAGLWFAGRRRQMIGTVFSRAGKVVSVALILCALANFVIFI